MSERAVTGPAIDYAIELQRILEAAQKFALRKILDDKAAGRIDFVAEFGACAVMTQFHATQLALGLKQMRKRAIECPADEAQIRAAIAKIREKIERELAS